MARAVGEYAKQQAITLPAVRNTEERAGLGLRAMTGRGELLVGKAALLAQNQVAYPEDILHIPDTIVVVALNGHYAGYLLLADEPKPDASPAVTDLRALGYRNLCILSGDKAALGGKRAGQLGISR